MNDKHPHSHSSKEPKSSSAEQDKAPRTKRITRPSLRDGTYLSPEQAKSGTYVLPPFPQPSKEEWQRRYHHEELIALGGMSSIHKVFDRHLFRSVAMKIIDAKVARGRTGTQRFLEEAQVTAQLSHPNIVPVHDLGIDHTGSHYFTLQYVEGTTLRSYLKRGEYHPSSDGVLYRVLQIFLKVCDALSFAHSLGVVHRDIKPENIMVGSHGEVYLMDWGLLRLVDAPSGEDERPHPDAAQSSPSIKLERDPSKNELDRPGVVLGSLHYLAPEQAYGQFEQIDMRTDIFSLGAILYEMLTRYPPYMARSPKEIIRMAKDCIISPPQHRAPDIYLPPELCRIAMRALQKDPMDRYQSVDELKEDLELFIQGGAQFTTETFAKGTVIIKEGDVGDMAYIIVSGRCQVYKMEDGLKRVLIELGPGEVFGETAVFSSKERTATVVALEDCIVKVLHRDALEQTVGFNSWVGHILKALATRFHKLDELASAQKKALENSELQQILIEYFAMYGERLNNHMLSTSWSELSVKLCARFQRSESEIYTAVTRLVQFTVDRGADLLYYKPAALL